MCTRVACSSFPEAHSIHEGQGAPRCHSSDRAAVPWTLPGGFVPLPAVPSSGVRPALPSPAHRQLTAATSGQRGSQTEHLPLGQSCQLQLSTPLALPIWPPPEPLSSFSVLENATQGGKFHQAAEHSAELTKDSCIVCLIHGHLGIPILKPQTKPHKSRFHLDPGLFFPANAP